MTGIAVDTGVAAGANAGDQPQGRHSGPRLSAGALATAWVLLVTIVSLVLRARSPAWLLPETPHDDARFAKLAGNIIDGRWLGSYDELTLAKGPGYPLFLAIAYEARAPFKMLEHVLHLSAGAAMGFAAFRVCRSWIVGIVVFTVITLDPAYLGAAAAKVDRGNVYGSLSLLLVAGLIIGCSLVPSFMRRGWRWVVPAVLVLGVLVGLGAAGYYAMREERQWLVPGLLVAIAAGIATWRGRRGAVLRYAVVTLVMFAVAGTTATICLNWMASRNERFYGTRVLADLVDGEVARAYTQWQRVRTGDELEYIPVNASQREAVYEISPAAAELEPTLEDPNIGWANTYCPDCEIPGAFFVWAMRDAAAAAGHATTGAETQRFFGRLADDIERACHEELDCANAGIGPIPPSYRFDYADVWSSSLTAARFLLSYDVGEPERKSVTGEAMPSGGREEYWRAMVRPLRGIGSHDQAEFRRDEARMMERQEGVAALTDVYRWAVRLAVIPALAGVVVGLVALVRARDARRLAAIVMCSAMLAAVLSRLALLGLADALSFGGAAEYGVYVLPGVDFLLVFLVLGCWLLFTGARDLVAARSGPKQGEGERQVS